MSIGSLDNSFQPYMTHVSRRKAVNPAWIYGFSCFAALLGAALWAASPTRDVRGIAAIDPDAMPIELDRGASGLGQMLMKLRTRASILMITAHPDDEDGGMLAFQSRGLGARAALMSLTRGEGGQNAMSQDLYDALGLLRTQELLAADRYYGVDEYWGTVIDYGFSKTREEALEKWGYERLLSDVVRVVRITRPLVITAVFVGAPTDGHGQHQVSGQMAQEAYVAAGDPNRFPEQIREGLRPWKPLKVYARVPFVSPNKDGTMYDYATDKNIPVRFYDYVNKAWMPQRPASNISIAEGSTDFRSGFTFLQISRTGWGLQKSQNGGGTTPQPSFYSSPYHRYGSRVPTEDQEKSFYDGINVSLAGIADLVEGDKGFLKDGLDRISKVTEQACDQYRPGDPAGIAPALAEGLADTRSLIEKVKNSALPEQGRDDVLFELEQKEQQFQKALELALGLSIEAAVAPEHPPTGAFAAFAGMQPTFIAAIPGQSFSVQTHLVNQGSEPVGVESVGVYAAEPEHWTVHPEKSPEPKLAAGTDARLTFNVAADQNATLTKPYFSRPNQEQPYYDLTDPRYRNLSLAPYPLWAEARIDYRGTQLELRRVVQTNRRVEGIGMEQNPLIVAPAISVTVSPNAGAVPLNAKSFTFMCTLQSNVKGAAQGELRLDMPSGWESNPAEYPFSFARDGDSDTVTFQVTPHDVQTKSYEMKAVAEYKGRKYEEGYRLAGYPGLRPYPYYTNASYRAVGVDVKTAPDLKVGFIAGTGDDVPRALEGLGLRVQVLSAGDVQSGDLSRYDAIVLGVRAYAVRPDLRAANNRLLNYVKDGGVLIVQYNLQSFDKDYGPYPFTLGSNPQKVVDENSHVKLVTPENGALRWPNVITAADFDGWEEERGHGFMQKWDAHYQPLVETHDPDQDPQLGGLLLARYGRGFYVYDAFALYRQLPSGVPGAYRILANLVSLGKNPEWK